ncbi:MAG: TIGR03663 family protein [Anaerolineae bacterium]|nr:TIGR03663 family protein [Anaerolineae bacterium]
MQNSGTSGKPRTQAALLDTPVFSVLHINLEVLLYVFLAIVAVVACFYNLGARAQSHDESLHALYSWKLYAGEGYEHNPMMHGPFLFHINALFYFLFGTSDFTARMSAAAFGVILVLLPAFLRKELGRVGALTTSALTLISPTTLYYARYIRNDIYMMVWAMLMVIALFRYLQSREHKWIYLGAIAVTLALTTKETAYITGFIGLTFVVALFIQQMFSAKGSRIAYTIGIALVILLVIVWIALNSYMGTLPDPAPGATEPSEGLTRGQVKKVDEVVFLLIGVLISMLMGTLLIKRDVRLKPAIGLIAAYVVAIGALVVFCATAGGAVWLVLVQMPEAVLPPLAFTLLQVVGIGGGAVAGGYAWWRLLGYGRKAGWLPAAFRDQVLYVTVALVVIIFSLLYTTFFTNPKGMGTGTFGAISYWLAQQEVKRAGQPWFYYLIIAPLYEFLPIGFGLVAVLYYLVTGKVDRPEDGEAAADQEGQLPSLPIVAFLVYWTLSAWLIYTWAGEKMPWLLVHVVQPMIVLTGRFVNDLLYGVDWRQVWRKGGAVLALLVPIILLALGMLISLLFFGQAFRGMSLGDLNDTSRWLSALVIGGALFWIALRLGRRLGQKAAWRVVFTSVLILGALLTIRFAWMASFINYDTAKEFLVYAHGTPDVKQTVEEIKEISRRLYGDEGSIKFAYSSDATWPFEWYFDTSFPNRVFYGEEPTRENTDVPVLVVGSKEIGKTEPFLGKRYYRFDRKVVWWPHQDYYMGLSLATPPEENRELGKKYLLIDLRDPEKRRQLWNVLFYRKYDQSLADWQPSHSFAFYVRKDVAAQLWDFGAEAAAVDLGEDEDPYAKNQRPLNTVSVWGGQGVAEGRFEEPRNVAIGPDGSVYVADSGNHRIQRFTADGQFITAWGHLCRMYENKDGCQTADGAGGFYDPWDVAVDRDGFVYVADTWNHRIQRFTADGQFVTMWGVYGVSESAAGAAGSFWGPRAVAVDAEGMIYVSDTGNKRIQVFTADGDPVTQWGGKGTLDGQFDEPVGVALGPDGQVFVADTWNQRIQAFDSAHFYSHKWEVYTWPGQSLSNKPYLAVDAMGRVYATDPEGYRILVFDENGTYLASLQQYGRDDQGFMLPTGIAVDPQGYIYVADPATDRLMRLAPLEE